MDSWTQRFGSKHFVTGTDNVTSVDDEMFAIKVSNSEIRSTRELLIILPFPPAS